MGTDDKYAMSMAMPEALEPHQVAEPDKRSWLDLYRENEALRQERDRLDLALKKVSAELELAYAAHRLTVLERDYERHRVNYLSERLSANSSQSAETRPLERLRTKIAYLDEG